MAQQTAPQPEAFHCTVPFSTIFKKKRKKDNLDVVLGFFDPPTSNSGSLAPFDCSGEVAQVHWELIRRATCHMAQCYPARGGRGTLRISFQPLQSKTVGQSDDGLKGALRLLVVLIPFPSSVSGLGSPLRSVLNHDYGLLNILFRTPLSLTCAFFQACESLLVSKLHTVIFPESSRDTRRAVDL